MKVKLSLMLMVAALISVPAYAQATLAGKWVGELSATDGHGVAQPVTLDLKIEGDAVSAHFAALGGPGGLGPAENSRARRRLAFADAAVTNQFQVPSFKFQVGWDWFVNLKHETWNLKLLTFAISRSGCFS